MKSLQLKISIQSLVAFLAFLASAFLLTRKFLTVPVLGFGDFLAFPTSPLTVVASQFVVWKPVNMGVVEGFNYNMITASILSSLFGPKIGQYILFLAEPTLAATSFYILIRRYSESLIANILSSLAYVVNPIFLFQFSVGPFLLMAYAMLPLVLLAFLKYSETAKLKDAILFVLVFALPNYFDYYAFLYEFLVVATYLGATTLLGTNRARSSRSLALLVVAPVVAVLSVLPSYSTVIFTTLNPSSLDYSLLPKIITARTNFAYDGASILNLVRFLAGPSAIVALYLKSFSIIGVAGFVVPGIAFSSLLFRPEGKQRTLLLSTAIAVVLTIGAISILRIVELPINPLTAVFRDPQRLMFVLGLLLCILLGFALNLIQSRLSAAVKKWSSRTGHLLPHISMSCLALFLLASILVFNAGALGGDMGLFKIYPENSLAMPNQYNAALQWLSARQASEGPFRTLWLPTDFYTYHWVTPSDALVFGAWPGSEQWNYPNIHVTASIFGLISDNRTTQLGKFLAPFAVRYVIVPALGDTNGAMHLTDLFIDSKGIVGSSAAFLMFLDRQSDLKRVYESGSFIAYQNMIEVPHHNIYHSSVLIFGSGKTPIDDIRYLYDFPNFDPRTQLTIQSSDVSLSDLDALSHSVNYLLYVNPQDEAVSLNNNAQLMDFTNTNNTSRLSIGISTTHPSNIGVAIESKTPNFNVSLGSQKPISLGSSLGPFPFQWYYENFTVETARAPLTISMSSPGDANQIVIFEIQQGATGPLIVMPNPTQRGGQEVSTFQSCTWTYLAESYSTTWTLSDKVLHVKAFSFGNAFCASVQDTLIDQYQFSYVGFVIVSIGTTSCLILSLAFLALTPSKAKRERKQ